MQNDLAPIVLFVYNRPWHTKQTLESLSENLLADKSTLFIYADGAKSNSSNTEQEKINEVRKIIRQKKWCGEIIIYESEKNNGLARSIINGVTEIVNRFGKIIVLEDDLVLSKGFLKYMNDSLSFYTNHEKVMHVSAYMYPVKKKLPETFFLRLATCWGWGTWKRAWDKFNPLTEELIQNLQSKNILDFDLNGGFGFYNLLNQVNEDETDSWAVKWYASLYLQDGLALHPMKALVNNIGNDGTGEHEEATKKYNINKLTENINIEKIDIEESNVVRNILSEYFKKNNRNVLSMARNLFHKFFK